MALKGGALLVGTVAASRTMALASSLPVSTGYADVPGGKVYWRRFGSGDKTPLLMLHGGPGAAHNYLLSMAALADERPVIFYDQLGCGKADAPRDESIYTIQRSVDEVDAIRKALNLDRVVLYGHSWGTLLAIEYLGQGRGAGVEKLVLAGALASVPSRCRAAAPDCRDAERLCGQAANAGTRGPDGHTGICGARPDFLRQFRAADQTIRRRCGQLRGDVQIDRLSRAERPQRIHHRGEIRDWDRRKDLKAITQKTLITAGQFDEITLDCHETIRDGIAGNARLAVMAGCSHMTMVEQPEKYNALVRSFLAET
jgi:proline iminopeptidase